MKIPTRLLAFAALLLALSAPIARAQAPAAQLTRDVQMFENGIALAGEGKFAEAIQSFQEIITRFPTSPAVPQAHFRVGYTYYLAGDYDKAVEAFEKLPTARPAPDAATLEIAAGMIPQIVVAKASKLEPGNKAREAAFADAATKFDAFIAKYPNSREVESANYSKAIALYQIARYDEAVTTLRGNLTKFAQSPTILDSQYLLGLTLGTIANVAAEKSTAPDPAVAQNYDEAERVLRDIIAKRRDLALLNDSQFQIGELLFGRGSHADERQKPAIMQRALEAYRAVFPKEAVVNAQKLRVEQFRTLSKQAQANRDLANRDALQRIADKEQEKIAVIEARPDQTITAKLKSGMIFFQLGKQDEARVVFNFIEPFAEDADTKKQLLYFTTLTYAVQGNVAKAVEKYEAFQAAHKGDPIAENLDLVLGGMFLTPGKEYTNPEKAIELLQRGLETYPAGRYTSELLMQKSMAEVQIGKFDEALKSFQDFLAKNPAKELAVVAEYGIGIVHMKTDKTAEALKAFTEVRDKYPGTDQAEDAAFYVGQLQLATDVKIAMTELKSFIEKFPDSRMLPEALYALAQSQLTTGDAAAAFQNYEQLASKHPESAPAPFSYFDRARHLAGEQKFDEVTALMKEFMEKYKENDMLYQAYDFVAQIQTSQGKGAEAIATYEEFVEAKPEHPTAAEALVKLAGLWKGYAESQGPYLALDEAKRAEWTKGVGKSLAASERIVANFSEHQAVASALNNMLAVLRLQQRVRIKSAADVEAYFTALLDKAKENPNLVSKITFAVSGFIAEQDKAKALKQMESVYRDDLRYGAEELDLFGRSLIGNKRYDEAMKVYEKVEIDYKPGGADPTKAPREVQDAQAIALFGKSKVLQEQAAALKTEGKADEAAKKTAEAGALAEQLKKLYGWSKYALEANFPQAQSLHEQKKDDEAMKLLIEVIKAKDATPELRARSMLLLGKIHQANGRNENAIDNFMKIASYYGAVADAAAEGLWLGAQLLEKQATGEIPMPTPPPKAAAPEKPAEKK
jgi:TolA-binding protein